MLYQFLQLSFSKQNIVSVITEVDYLYSYTSLDPEFTSFNIFE